MKVLNSLQGAFALFQFEFFIVPSTQINIYNSVNPCFQ